MEQFRVDWHIHTTLSPCGSLSMEPSVILRQACRKGLQVIGITDHNSTRQARIIKTGQQIPGVLILAGAEVTTSEEIHCLAFFDDIADLDEFQDYLDRHLPAIDNNVELFGDQVVVDFNGNIVFEEKRLLISGINQSLSELAAFVMSRNGILIPAHINRTSFSLMSQLGMIPSDLPANALEWVPIYGQDSKDRVLENLYGFPVVFSSDAHMPEDIGQRFSILQLGELTFKGIRHSLNSMRTSIAKQDKSKDL